MKKQHPCAGWCGQILVGIVDNLKLRGELPDDFQVEFRSLVGLVYVPKGSYILTCQHDREYMAMVKEP